MARIELHPLCTLFPRLSGAEFDALRDDIAANGLRHPIVTHDGMILDGGNRYAACLAAGIKPTFAKFTGESIGSFVLSANMHRRHLSAGVQAAIVASVQSWGEAQPASRPKKGCNVAPLSTVADRMAQSGASERTQKMADKVAKASPELAKQVAHGEISLPKAVQQIEPAKPAKASKPAPTIESLMAENATLRTDLGEAMQNARELSDALAGYATAEEGEAAAAAEITRLLRQLSATESQRDRLMVTNSELKKEVKMLRRKLGQTA